MGIVSLSAAPPFITKDGSGIRELLASHVADAQCAMCHKHFDSLGLAMEGFDAIGRSRTTDLAGRVVDHVAELPNGETADGIPGLIDYIDQHRRQDFIRTMCRKFLGYALGRSVALSDQILLDEMEAALERNEYRFSVMFEVVVRPPFRWMNSVTEEEKRKPLRSCFCSLDSERTRRLQPRQCHACTECAQNNPP